ncbi:MAG: hypothetical protein OXG04_11420 [Acidobacteria bacterium]|nr:hypothetical protein [Acidobacteriota bacterium]
MTEGRRARRGCTYDPWPCCGKVITWNGGRPKGTICPACSRLIRLGEDAEKRTRETDTGIYTWAEQSHWWPRYYGPYSFEQRDTAEKLAQAMFDLIEAVSVLRETREHGYGSLGKSGQSEGPVLECIGEDGRPRRYESGGTALVHIPRAVRERLDNLDANIRTALREAYAEGNRRGRSILRQLAAGEMSLSDFEKRDQ